MLGNKDQPSWPSGKAFHSYLMIWKDHPFDSDLRHFLLPFVTSIELLFLALILLIESLRLFGCVVVQCFVGVVG